MIAEAFSQNKNLHSFHCGAPSNHTCVGMPCIGCIYNELRPPEPVPTSGPAFTVDELLKLHKDTTEACREVMRKKNHDYTSGGSPFANFRDSSIIGVSPVLGILIRSIDKFKRVQTFVQSGTLAVEGEGVLDALDDVINYMILAKGIILEDQRMKPPVQPNL